MLNICVQQVLHLVQDCPDCIRGKAMPGRFPNSDFKHRNSKNIQQQRRHRLPPDTSMAARANRKRSKQTNYST